MENSIIDELKLKIDVETIKPYLTNHGFDFTSHDERDKFAYFVARKDNLRYLSFGIGHFQGFDLSYAPTYEYKYGQIVYDERGHVLLDCTWKKSPDIWFWEDKKETYEIVDPSLIFIDDDTLLITEELKEYAPYRVTPHYEIYKFKNCGYSLASGLFVGYSNIVKTSGGDLFISSDSGLYRVKDLKHLSNLKFDSVIGVSDCLKDIILDISYLDSNEQEQIYNIIKNNNLLFAYSMIESDNCYRTNDALIFTFMDTDGNITGKLYFKSDLEFYSKDVDNKTYEQVKEGCRQHLNYKAALEVKKELAAERRKINKERMLRSKASDEMIDALLTDFNKDNSPKILTYSNDKL